MSSTGNIGYQTKARYLRHSLRRAALRSALAASRTISTTTRITPLAARTAADCNIARLALPQSGRFFSQTTRQRSDDKDLEEAQRRAEEELDRQAAADASQDVEESVRQTEEDIQEAMQEVQPTRQGPRSADAHSAFIRNIVFELTEDHLVKAFSKYGTVQNAHIARDPRGLSKGYGFVSFASAEELKEACASVNGSFWHGRRVTCIPRATDRESSGPRPQRTRSVPNEPTSQLFVGNIPYETTDAELNRLFKGMDNLNDVRVAVDRTTGWPRGFAHADFASVEAATMAKNKLEGAMLGDRRLRIDFAAGYQKRNADSRPRREPREPRDDAPLE
ncbi:RNA-binding domain-containing protein [Parathielavia hyrcaniae]|uniref:RNA-binding domain-containing protein n=1 Tax=Parathielavia hyrcaniae TaxID=113614 RepID=A0AAN6Q3Y7_9PEZI|nr:RNA-binding domain-containing protein [Parathielavia hyrcaniae]